MVLIDFHQGFRLVTGVIIKETKSLVIVCVWLGFLQTILFFHWWWVVTLVTRVETFGKNLLRPRSIFSPYLVERLLLSGLGLGPLTVRCPSECVLKATSRILPGTSSDARDDTEKRDKSVVTDSWLGDRSIRHVTIGVWGVFPPEASIIISSIISRWYLHRCFCHWD